MKTFCSVHEKLGDHVFQPHILVKLIKQRLPPPLNLVHAFLQIETLASKDGIVHYFFLEEQ